jgi:hypothetical protein
VSFHSRSGRGRKVRRGCFNDGVGEAREGRTRGWERAKRTLLQWLQALKGDLKFVFVGELCGVVHHIDPEKRDDRHLGGGVAMPLCVACTVNKKNWRRQTCANLALQCGSEVKKSSGSGRGTLGENGSAKQSCLFWSSVTFKMRPRAVEGPNGRATKWAHFFWGAWAFPSWIRGSPFRRGLRVA